MCLFLFCTYAVYSWLDDYYAYLSIASNHTKQVKLLAPRSRARVVACVCTCDSRWRLWHFPAAALRFFCPLEAGVPIDPHTRHPLIFFLLFGVQLVDGRPPSEPDFIAWLKEWLAIPCDAYHPESLR